MTGFLTYILNRMRTENEYTLGFVLNALVAKMFGWKDYVVNELRASELHRLASGLLLLLESSQIIKNRKS